MGFAELFSPCARTFSYAHFLQLRARTTARTPSNLLRTMSLHFTTLALAALSTAVSALYPRQDSQASAGSSAAASSAVASSAAVSSAAASAVPSGAVAVGDLNRSVNISIDGTIIPLPISPFGSPMSVL